MAEIIFLDKILTYQLDKLKDIEECCAECQEYVLKKIYMHYKNKGFCITNPIPIKQNVLESLILHIMAENIELHHKFGHCKPYYFHRIKSLVLYAIELYRNSLHYNQELDIEQEVCTCIAKKYRRKTD